MDHPCSLVLLLCVCVCCSRAVAKPAIFMFGDSLSDVGNNNYLQYALAKSNFPWYGIDYYGRVATGRFTNGRTIGDIICQRLGLTVPPPYLSLSANDDRILKGVNFASGGGGILNETGYLFIQRLSFDKQIEYFETTKKAIVGKIGSLAAERLCNEALFFVGIGSNDYINNFLLPFSPDAQKYTIEGFNQLLVETLGQQFSRLHSLGARKIVYNGLAPLGCIPSQRTKSGVGNNTVCLEGLNNWVSQFNGAVQSLLQRLNRQLPGASITYVDNYSIVGKLVRDPHSYGFRVADTPCCDVQTTLGQLCLPNSNLCRDRKSYVFWDAFHPTDAANVVIANDVLSHPKLLQYFPSAPSPSLANHRHHLPAARASENHRHHLPSARASANRHRRNGGNVPHSPFSSPPSTLRNSREETKDMHA